MRVFLTLFALFALFSVISAQTNSSSSSSSGASIASSSSSGSSATSTPSTNASSSSTIFRSSSSSSTGGSSTSSCYTCSVSQCSPYLPSYNASSLPISIQLPNINGTGPFICAALQSDIATFINTATNATCQAQVGAFGCAAVAQVNATEQACNISSIGGGLPNVTQEFTAYCQSELLSGCLGSFVYSELTSFGACSSYQAFFNALPAIAQAAASLSSSTGSSSTNGTNAAMKATGVGMGGLIAVGAGLAMVGLMGF